MTPHLPRWPAFLGVAASFLGLAFSMSSTLDYARHLDRQVHDLHCSFVPGVGVATGADTACRTAMYSAYSALFRSSYWGGVPISLFSVGAFSFFAAFALYLALAGSHAPRKAHGFYFGASLTPLLVSVGMGTLSAVVLGSFCKTCVGIYASSALLALSGLLVFVADRRAGAHEAMLAAAPPAPQPATPAQPSPPPPHAVVRASGSWLGPLAWLGALGLSSAAPAGLYVSTLPDYSTQIASCGTLKERTEPTGALLQITPAGAKQPATLVVDPLCPTCKGFHKRLVSEGFFQQLDMSVVLFPLDSECNWNLDRPFHPGACVVAKAVLCADKRALDVLEWAYEKQDELTAAAKAGAGVVNVRSMVSQRWPDVDKCIDAKETKLRLDKHLRFAVRNQLEVSTPQLFLGDKRLCVEDSDLGMAWALPKLAPEVKAR